MTQKRYSEQLAGQKASDNVVDNDMGRGADGNHGGQGRSQARAGAKMPYKIDDDESEREDGNAPLGVRGDDTPEEKLKYARLQTEGY